MWAGNVALLGPSLVMGPELGDLAGDQRGAGAGRMPSTSTALQLLTPVWDIRAVVSNRMQFPSSFTNCILARKSVIMKDCLGVVGTQDTV